MDYCISALFGWKSSFILDIIQFKNFNSCFCKALCVNMYCYSIKMTQGYKNWSAWSSINNTLFTLWVKFGFMYGMFVLLWVWTGNNTLHLTFSIPAWSNFICCPEIWYMISGIMITVWTVNLNSCNFNPTETQMFKVNNKIISICT